MNRHKGFTVLELLVVIAIIAIVSALGLVVFSSARAKSRDTRRTADIRQIQNALSLYAASNRNLFPSMGSGTNCAGGDFDGNPQTNTLEVALAPLHIPSVPGYQQYNATTMYGRYCSIGGGGVGTATAVSYEIQFCLETNSIKGYTAGCPATNVIRP